MSSSVATSITGSNVVSLNYPNFLHLRSNLGSLITYNGQIDDYNVANNILARVPLDKNYGEVVYYKAINDELDYFLTDTYIQQISYYFTYPDINNPAQDIIVDFNGGITSLKLKVFSAA